MDRRAAELLGPIDSDIRILELGPSMSPMAPRSAGWNVTVVDHASREDLVAKYRNDANVDVDKIEDVDVIWRGGHLHEAVPKDLHGAFDLLIASHVIEHLPDPIGFLDSAAHLLNPERGVVALVVPDKRMHFDCMRQVSTTGQMLAAHRMKLQRHSMVTLFENGAYVAFDGARDNPRIAWGRDPLPGLWLADSLDNAYQGFLSWSSDADAPYIDCHAWQFTPASFELLMLEIGALGLIDWRIDWLQPRPQVEFFARLTRGRPQFASPAEREARRLELLRRILFDLREQTDWLLATEPAKPKLASSVAVFDAETRKLLEESNQLLRENQLLLQDVAETSAMLRTALRPMRAVWRQALPLRRLVARLRGKFRESLDRLDVAPRTHGAFKVNRPGNTGGFRI